MSYLSAAKVDVTNGTVIINGTTGSGIANLEATKINVDGTVTATTLNVDYLTITSGFDVSGNLGIGGSLTVLGPSDFNGLVTAPVGVSVTGVTTVDTLDITDSITLGTLDVTTLNVTGSATINDVNVTGTVTAPSLIVDTLETVNGTVTAESITSGAGFSVDVSGNVEIPALLNVTGSVWMGNGLYVDGSFVGNQDVNVNSSMTVLENEYVGNDLFVGNALQMQITDTSSIYLTGAKLYALLALI
jgi:hypothetical protein